MAASHTTNLELNKPARTDFVSVITDINDNMDMIDAAIGALPSGKNVQGQIDELGNDKVPATRTVNGKALSSDVTLHGSDIEMNSGDSTKVDAAITALQGNVADLQETDEANYVKLDGIKANSENIYLYKEASGDVVEVYDAVAEAVKQMQIEIAPLQDLHGYDHPWVGGSGKNLLDTSNMSTETKNGVTFSRSSDGVITVGGNNTGTTVYRQVGSIQTVSGVSYICTGTPANGSSQNYRMTIGGYGYDYGSGYTFTGDGDTHTISIDIYAGYPTSGTTLTFKPMIRLASVSDDTYAPYSNICPISGFTGAKVTDRKKNLLPKFGSEWITGTTETYFAAKTSDTTPTFPFTFGTSGSSSYTGVPVYVIECKPNTTYTIKPPTGTKPIVSEYATIEGISSKANALARWTDNTTGYSNAITKTTQATAKYLVISFSAYSASASVTVDENTEFQLEEGSVSTPFEAFATNYSITFPSSAGTVYGGTLTVNQDGTGTLVVDRAIHDFGDFTYTYESSYTRFRSSTVSGQEIPATSRTGQGVCSCYQVLSHAEAITDVPNGSIYNGASSGNPVVWVHDSRYTDPTEFKTALTGQKFVFKLATASTYTLSTDQVIHLLSGNNTIYADCGDLTILYPSDAHQTVEQAEKERIHQSITTSSSVQTFADGADNVPMWMKVEVEPVQDLHGYGYPWVGGAGKNLCKLTVSGIKSANTTGTWDNNEYTINGIKYKIILDSDGNIEKITANETATADWVRLNGDSFVLPSGTYILSGCVGGESASYRTTLMAGSSTIISSYDGDSAEFTLSETTTVFVAMIIRTSGYVASNVEFKPMVRLSSVTDATYAPWENICPITGWTGANVTRTGKNLVNGYGTNIDRGYVYNRYLATDGSYVTPQNQWDITEYVAVKPNTDYVYSGGYSSAGTNCIEYDENFNVLANHSQSPSTITFTTNASAKWMRFSVKEGYRNVQFEEGSTASAYEPFGLTYTIPFNTDCYGGSLTVNKDGTGVLTVDIVHRLVSSLSWSYSLSQQRFYVQLTDSYSNPSNVVDPYLKCSHYKVATYGDLTAAREDQAIADGNQYFSIRDTNYTSISDLVNALGDVSFIYKLATPVTYTIPAHVIRSLLGTNCVFADTGDVQEIQYSADTKSYIDNLFATIINGTGVSF